MEKTRGIPINPIVIFVKNGATRFIKADPTSNQSLLEIKEGGHVAARRKKRD